MKTISDYLDEAKKVTGSDYETAKQIGVTRQAISTARRTGTLCNNSAVKIAGLIGKNPAEIIAVSDIKNHPENAAHWGKWVAACLIMGLLATSNNAVNTVVAAEFNNSNSYRLCEVLGAFYMGLIVMI